jgi:hypothetical protein
MKAKVHPHRNKVNSGETACVSVTPIGGHAYYMGTVVLSDVSFVIHASGLTRARNEQVRNVHAWAVGDVIFESPLQVPVEPMELTQVTYHYNVGRFVTLAGTDVTDSNFNRALFRGRDFYVEV